MPINLLDYQSALTIKQVEGVAHVKCLIRLKYIVLTPEEFVRQLLVLYLVKNKHYSKNQIAIEKAYKINGLLKRVDLLILDSFGNPFLLIECKEPKVRLDNKVMEQVLIYNKTVKSPFLCICNGLITSVFSQKNDMINKIKYFPIPS